jgi:hypothetical protein
MLEGRHHDIDGTWHHDIEGNHDIIVSFFIKMDRCIFSSFIHGHCNNSFVLSYHKKDPYASAGDVNMAKELMYSSFRPKQKESKHMWLDIVVFTLGERDL